MGVYSDEEIAAVKKAATEIADAIIRSGPEYRLQIAGDYQISEHLVEVVLGSAFLIAAVASLSEAYNLDAGYLGVRLNHVVNEYVNESRTQ